MTSDEYGKRIVDMQETLYRVCCGMLAQACDREDAVQECIRIAWQKIASLRDDRFLQTWVIRILIHECYGVSRRKKRERLVEEAPAYIAPPDANADLHEALMALPPALRLPVTLHYFEGYPLDDIARILRIPVGTVKSRLNRARKQLKTFIQGEEMVSL